MNSSSSYPVENNNNNSEELSSTDENTWNQIIPVAPHLKKSKYGFNRYLVLLSFVTPFHLIAAGLFASLFLPTKLIVLLSFVFFLVPVIKQALRYFEYLPVPYSEYIIHEPYAAKCDGDFVVFLIGARPNGAFPLTKKFIDLGNAFQSMVKELESDPSLGYMGGDVYVGANDRKSGVIYVQYWRSYEALQKWTHTKMGSHVKTMIDYMKNEKDVGTYGIWHETYKVRDGEYEAIYAHMPPFGLALATQIVPEQKHNNGPGRMQRREKEKQAEAEEAQVQPEIITYDEVKED